MTFQEFIKPLPAERQSALTTLRDAVLKNLPKGFEESIDGGMIHYVVPFSIYPKGYHCNTAKPLPFISIASQKNFLAMYHMGLYASPELLKWFTDEYPNHSKTKLDMGKSCIRFKKPAEIPADLMGKLAGKMKPKEWIDMYEKAFRK